MTPHMITPPATQTDTPVIPTETPIITPTIPPSPDYTPASPDYSPASDSESDPSEDPSSDHIPPLPAISPFLSSDDDTTDSDTPDTPPSPTHVSTWSEPFTPLHLNGLVHMMTARKRVGPLPTHRLAVRHFANHCSLDSSSEASLDFHSQCFRAERCASSRPSCQIIPHNMILEIVEMMLLIVKGLVMSLIRAGYRYRDHEIDEMTGVKGWLRTGLEVTASCDAEGFPEPAQEGAIEVTMINWEIWFRGSMITLRLSQSIVYRLLREFRESRDT
ncbi:hypothetical protein Tco_0712095 [Tanacetum coccineum]